MRRKTKDTLLEETENLIISNGYNNIRVEDITKASEVAKGTFYLYFKTKDDIFLELINKKIDSYLEKIKLINEFNKEMDLAKQLYQINSALCKIISEEKYFAAVVEKLIKENKNSIGNSIVKIFDEKIEKLKNEIKIIFKRAIIKEEISKKYETYIDKIVSFYIILINKEIVNKILKGNMDYFELDDETAEKDINFATYIFLNGIIIK